MSKKIKIDDLFKDNLDNYVSPVSANMWASIDAELAKKANPRKTGMILFWSVLAVIVVSLLGFVLMQSDLSTPNTIKADAAIVKQDHVQHILESKIDRNNKEINEIFNRPIVDRNDIDKKESTDKKVESVKQPLADLDASLKQKKETNTNKVDQAVNYATQNIATATAQDVIDRPNIQTINPQTVNTTSFKENLDLTPVSEGRQESSATNEDQQSEANTLNNVVFDSSLKEKMHRFPVVPLFNPSIKEVLPLNEYDITDKSCPSSFKMTHRPKFAIDGLLGFDYANRSFTPRLDNQAAQNYIDIREDTEKFASSYSLGARVSVSYHTGFVWRIGLMYHRLNEKINLIGKEAYAHIPDALILEQDNIYQFVDVPILIGYETTNGKMTYGFNAGMYVNLSFSSPTNYILSSDKNKILLNDPVTISESPVFKGQLGLSAYGSLFATYDLTDHLSVICEPSVLVRPQSVTLSDYELEQRYVHIGLTTGFRYKF